MAERALKKAILHRKNSLFYKKDNGARVGDLYMALISMCELNGTDPFDYPMQLQVHAKMVRAHPKNWTPWNYPRIRGPKVLNENEDSAVRNSAYFALLKIDGREPGISEIIKFEFPQDVDWDYVYRCSNYTQ